MSKQSTLRKYSDERSASNPSDLAPKSSGRTAFLSLRDFSAVRNYLRPEMVEAMAKSGHRFVVLTPDPDNEFVKDYFNHPAFTIERLEMEKVDQAQRRSRLYQFLRMVRNFTYGNAPFREMGTRRYHLQVYREEVVAKATTLFGKIYYHGIIVGARIASASRIVRKLVRWLEGKVLPVTPHRELYERYKPSMLVIPSLGYSLDPVLMREAKQFGARSLSIVRSWDNTTSKGYAGFPPDHVFAWHDIMREEAIRFHDIPPERVEVCGIPHWDIYFNDGPKLSRAAFLAKYKLRPDRKIIYFATAGAGNFRHNTTLARQLLEAIRNGEIKEPSQVLLRLHPSYQTSRANLMRDKWRDQTHEMVELIPQLKREFGDLLSVSDQVVENIGGMLILSDENQVDLDAIYRHSDVLVNVYSTQMIEAAIFDLPIINAGYLPLRRTNMPISVYEVWDHIRRVLDTKAVTNCHSREAMIAAINADLADRCRLSAERKLLAEQEAGCFRGHAALQTVKRIIELV